MPSLLLLLLLLAQTVKHGAGYALDSEVLAATTLVWGGDPALGVATDIRCPDGGAPSMPYQVYAPSNPAPPPSTVSHPPAHYLAHVLALLLLLIPSC
jgi:hypothetical protein